MPKDLTVILKDEPGELARMGETLGAAGINIEGMCGVTVGDRGILHVLVDDAAAAGQALAAGDFRVPEETEVLLVDVVEDQPGRLGEIARRLTETGINIHLAYQASSSRLVLAVSDLSKARAALQLE